MDAVFEAAVQNGFVVVERRSKKPHPVHGDTRFELVCVRGREYVPRGSEKRNTPSARDGCPWNGYIQYYIREATWKFMLHANENKNTHNHTCLDAAGFAVSRRRERKHDEGVHTRIEQMSKRRKCTNQDIAEDLNEERGMHLTRWDVRNVRAEEHQRKLGGRTATQQFVDNLRRDDETRMIDLRVGASGHLEYAMWTSKWALRMWKENPHVLSIDNTYKTNQCNLPLCQVVGASGWVQRLVSPGPY